MKDSIHDIINYEALQNVINENFKDEPVDFHNSMASFYETCHLCCIYNPETMCDKCPVGMMIVGLKEIAKNNSNKSLKTIAINR